MRKTAWESQIRSGYHRLFPVVSVSDWRTTGEQDLLFTTAYSRSPAASRASSLVQKTWVDKRPTSTGNLLLRLACPLHTLQPK
jgi:hypothetical protein